jgi:hypothetical protein
VGQTAQGAELTLNGSLDAGYDNNVVAESLTGASDPHLQANGSQAGGTVGLTYLVQRRRVGFGGSIGSTFRQYQTSNSLTTAGYNAGFGFAATPTMRTQLQASFSGSYSPLYEFSVLPQVGESKLGQIPGPVLDYGLSVTDVVMYSAGLRYAYSPRRRSSFELTADVGRTLFSGQRPDLMTRDAGGRFIHGLTKNASLNLGYTYIEGQWPEAGGSTRTVHNHNLDIGINYDRPLSLSRRTKVSFGFGSGAFDDGARTYYNVRGHASLSHEISRTWTAALSYRRGFSLIPGFTAPFFADSFGFNVGGGATRRLSLSGSGGYSIGDVGLGQVGRGYDSYTARASAQFSLSRWLAAYGEYLYYHYRFTDAIVLPIDAGSSLNRRGVRVGANFVLPLISQRRAVAAR